MDALLAIMEVGGKVKQISFDESIELLSEWDLSE